MTSNIFDVETLDALLNDPSCITIDWKAAQKLQRKTGKNNSSQVNVQRYPIKILYNGEPRDINLRVTDIPIYGGVKEVREFNKVKVGFAINDDAFGNVINKLDGVLRDKIDNYVNNNTTLRGNKTVIPLIQREMNAEKHPGFSSEQLKLAKPIFRVNIPFKSNYDDDGNTKDNDSTPKPIACTVLKKLGNGKGATYYVERFDGKKEPITTANCHEAFKAYVLVSGCINFSVVIRSVAGFNIRAAFSSMLLEKSKDNRPTNLDIFPGLQIVDNDDNNDDSSCSNLDDTITKLSVIRSPEKPHNKQRMDETKIETKTETHSDSDTDNTDDIDMVDTASADMASKLRLSLTARNKNNFVVEGDDEL